MSVHQPQTSDQQRLQQGEGSGSTSESNGSSGSGSGIQCLTVRTDSVTLSPPSQLRTTPLFSPSKDTYNESGSAHQKHASTSSIASSSTSASTSSKTEAFFSANHEAGVRPARSSTASVHTPGRAESSSSSSPPQAQQRSPTAPLSRGNVARMASAANTLGATHPASSDAMELDRSSSQSSTGRRNWRDFEGRSITPLPSPGGVADDRQQGDADTYRFPAVQSTQTSALQAAQSSSSSSWGSSSSSSSSRSASIASRQIPSWSGSDVVDSPKTSNFFDSPARSTHPFRLILPKESRAGLPHERQHDYRPRFPSSSDTGSGSIHAPSRFPSINAHHPTPGSSGTSEAAGQSWHIQLTDAHAPSLESSATLVDTDMTSNFSESTQTTPRLVPGTHPIVAYVSPPSPDPGSASTDEAPPALSSTDSSTPSSSSSSSSSSRRSNNSGRHTHGPSENATSSSILPSFALQRQQRDSPSPATTQDAAQKQDYGHDARGSEASPLGTPKADESEDEASGRVGAYTVERSLGVGAFSRVVLARRSRSTPASRSGSVNDSLVALKMLEKEPCRQNERMRVSWVREVEVLKHIVHPNVVRFISSFSTDKHHVLVLETVEGGELFEFLANEQSDIVQREWLVRALFGELANAVGWMHSINLVHRDIKLENIILTKHFRAAYPLAPARLPGNDTPLIKLSDFGLSRFIDPQAPHLETRCGSEEYAAPELIIGKRYDGRQTDVWAMGVVLYALLSGSLPFLTASGETDERSSGSSRAQSRDGDTPGLSQRQLQQADARTRKAHLLRIAKGDLRWPARTNDGCQDVPDGVECPIQHRLITPPARLLVARLLRRDAAKRAAAWDVWDEAWMRSGSFQDREASMLGQAFEPPADPRSTKGLAWLQAHACVQAGAPDVVRDD